MIESDVVTVAAALAAIDPGPAEEAGAREAGAADAGAPGGDACCATGAGATPGGDVRAHAAATSAAPIKTAILFTVLFP